MKIGIQIVLIIIFLTSSFNTIDSIAQENKILFIEQINNSIDSISNICNGSDTLCTETFSHGHSKFYKNIFGLIKVRYGKGDAFRNSWISAGHLFHHNWSSVRVKKNKSYHITENYYYVKSSLVKYERSAFWSFKNGKNDTLEEKVILYFINGEIIEKQAKIYDKYKLTAKEVERILEYSDRLVKEHEGFLKKEIPSS